MKYLTINNHHINAQYIIFINVYNAIFVFCVPPYRALFVQLTGVYRALYQIQLDVKLCSSLAHHIDQNRYGKIVQIG